MIDRDRLLLERARAAGVSFTVEGDKLKYRAPAGAMSPDLRAILKELKASLVFEYHERAAIHEYHGGLPRTEAEARAAASVLAGAV